MTVRPSDLEPESPGAEGLVWHYTDGPGLLSILAGNVLWATASGYLNDTSEVELGNRLMLERFTVLADSHHPVFSALRDRLAESDAKQGPSPGWFFILSASTSPDSLAMWRSYGGRGESYAIGLDPAAELKVLVDDVAATERVLIRQKGWMPVRYDRADQDALIEAVYAELPDDLAAVAELRDRGNPSTADYLDAVADTLEAAEQALLLIKHHGFREEQETRRTTVVFGEEGQGPGADRGREVPAHGLRDGAVPPAHGCLRCHQRCRHPGAGAAAHPRRGDLTHSQRCRRRGVPPRAPGRPRDAARRGAALRHPLQGLSRSTGWTRVTPG